MATAFNTQTGNGEYRLQFETDNMDHFLLMQATARQCVDGKPQTHADQIRAMSDEELEPTILAFKLGYAPWCDHHCENEGEYGCDTCILNWLQQPVEVSDHA